MRAQQRGLAGLLSVRPSSSTATRARSGMSFVDMLACLDDALQFRLSGLPDRTLDGLFNTPVLRRPAMEDLSVSAWTQSIGSRAEVSVLAIQTPNDAALYVDGRPVSMVSKEDVASAVSRGLLPEALASIPPFES